MTWKAGLRGSPKSTTAPMSGGITRLAVSTWGDWRSATQCKEAADEMTRQELRYAGILSS